MIISPLVLAEVDHLAKARFGTQARTTIVDFVMDLDLADAVNVGLAAHYRTDARLTSTVATSAPCGRSPHTSGSASYPTISSSASGEVRHQRRNRSRTQTEPRPPPDRLSLLPPGISLRSHAP